MSFSVTVTRKFKYVDDESSQAETVTGGQLIQISESIANASTDLAVTCNIDKSALKAIYIHSDKAVTLETNNGSAPTDTITLAANQAIIWTNSDPAAMCPLSADVTALYVTNASGTAAAITLKALQDPTP